MQKITIGITGFLGSGLRDCRLNFRRPLLVNNRLKFRLICSWAKKYVCGSQATPGPLARNVARRKVCRLQAKPYWVPSIVYLGNKQKLFSKSIQSCSQHPGLTGSHEIGQRGKKNIPVSSSTYRTGHVREYPPSFNPKRTRRSKSWLTDFLSSKMLCFPRFSTRETKLQYCCLKITRDN